MMNLLEIDREILKFMGGKPIDSDVYEFVNRNFQGKITSVYRTTLSNKKFFHDWKSTMEILLFIERLGYSTLIEDNTCIICPKVDENNDYSPVTPIFHIERRDTKQWAIYHCVYNFILKYNAYKEKRKKEETIINKGELRDGC